MLQAQRSRHLFQPFPRNLKLFITSQANPPNAFYSLLDLCRYPRHLQQVHARFILHGLHQNTALASKLINSYANLGHISVSQQVFYSVTNTNTHLYNEFLRCLYKSCEYKKILLVYQDMVLKLMDPDEFIYPFVLRSCFKMPDYETGKKIHGHVIKLGLDVYESVARSLVDMNGEAIEKMGVSSLVNWNSMIFYAYANGDPERSFQLFNRMRTERIEPDSATVINLLRAAVDSNSLKAGKYVHSLIVVTSLYQDMAVNTALLTMYWKLDDIEDARLMFDNMPVRDCVVWNLMISAYSRNGSPEESLELLMEMMRSGVRADLCTAIPAISSIAELKSLEWAKQIHAHVVRNGSDYQLLRNCKKIFDSVTNKTQVSWSAMIKGYVNHDCFRDASSLFMEMKLSGSRIDSVAVINVLPALVNIGALEQVKHLHGYSIKCALNLSLSVNSSLLISYAKCGCIDIARKLFDEEEVDSKDIILWNSMINAYSKHGDWFRCVELYNQMKQSKVRPDHITFLGLLTACVNSGFVQEARECFNEMIEIYGYQPNQEHYACMVDLLGRAGHLKEASELINTMPLKPDARTWGPLLSACKMHSETKLAEVAAEKLITMEPKNSGNYVLLSNIYAAAGKWHEVAKMRIFLRDRGLKKLPGCSWLEINGQVHEFRVADRSHPRSNDIYTALKNLELEIMDIEQNSFENPSWEPICVAEQVL
ncbi:hypothetical protein NMG60_11019151 [Bertholletia excelsa]